MTGSDDAAVNLSEDDRFAIPVFVAMIALAGLLMAVVVPPFQVPDEGAHFFRVVALSRGTIRTTIHRGEKGAWLPAWSISMARSFLSDLPGHPERKTSVEQTRASSPPHFGDERKSFVSAGSPDPSLIERRTQYTAAGYTPVPYLAPTIAVSLARLLGASPLHSFYLGRLANLLLATSLILLALRIIPFGRWVIALVALTPMSLHLLASYSADSLTISSSLLMVAAALRWLRDRDPNAGRIMIFATLLVCLCKANCAFVFLPFFALFQRREQSPRKILTFQMCAILAGLSLIILCALNGAPTRPAAGYSASGQVTHILKNPGDFLGTMARTIESLVTQYEVEFVGTLGWLDTRLPMTLTISWYALLILMASTSVVASKGSASDTANSLAPRERLLLAGFFILSAATTFVVAYLAWNPVGAGIINGVQGRYFLPFAALLFLSMNRLIQLPAIAGRFREWIAASAVTAGLAVTLLVVVDRYYG